VVFRKKQKRPWHLLVQKTLAHQDQVVAKII